jgi:hypothetical protein
MASAHQGIEKGLGPGQGQEWIIRIAFIAGTLEEKPPGACAPPQIAPEFGEVEVFDEMANRQRLEMPLLRFAIPAQPRRRRRLQ